MVRGEINEKHTKLKRGDSKGENTVKPQSNGNSTLYTKILEFEEYEALSIQEGHDLELFKETCNKFRDVINRVALLKLKKEPENLGKINDARIEGSVLFTKMKKLNRLEKFRLNHAREKLYKAKRQVDNSHLQWQNLLYETHHLRREITKCLSFKSKDEHIDLVPVEEFYKNAPESISVPEVTTKNEHKLKIARLEWELEQRKKLADTCHKFEQDKEKISGEIKMKKERMDNLVPMIRSILSATKPVQEHLGLPQSLIQIEPEMTQLLPPALYFLTIQADALREACDPLIKVTVVGDKSAASRVNSNMSELTLFVDTDSDEESKNHHHRRKSKTQIRQEKIKKLLMKHPLSVNLKISLKDETTISIVFYYLINLRIVTVMPKIDDTHFDSICCRYLLDPRNVLNGVYSNDFGERSPNATNAYQLQQLGIEFNAEELGIPYLWAQKLCGLDFTGYTHNPKMNAEQRNMSATVNKIREHVKIILNLSEQLNDLENLLMPDKYQNLTNLPVKMGCTLTKWEMLSYEQLPAFINVSQFINNSESVDHDKYFLAIFIRNTAKLTAVILVQPTYPNSVPVFSLFIENNDKQYSAESHNNVRDMEKEINFYTEELIEKLGNLNSWILTAQLYKLAVCFDIFLECTDSENFPREKLFYFHARGRTRSLPFKFNQRGNEGIFVQR